MYYTLLYLVSDTLISLYGVTIKIFGHIPLHHHLLIRSIIFTLLSTVSLLKVPSITWETFGLSIANLTSILGMYIGFKNLDIGVANSLFFTWPILYYLITIPTLKTHTFNSKQFAILIVLLIASIMVLGKKGVSNSNSNSNSDTNMFIGIFGIILAILTHIFIIIYYKIDVTQNIHKYLQNQYFIMLIVMVIYTLYNLGKTVTFIENNVSNYLCIMLFNIVAGYLAFYLNFYSVGHISNYALSMTTFLTIVISFLFGSIFLGEKTSIIQWVGILIISFLNIKSLG